MKNTTMKIMTLFIAVSVILAACSKKDSASNESIDETMLYGKWQSIHHIINGQTYDFDVMIEIISDGTGVIETTEISNPVPFTWSLSGNSLKNHGKQQYCQVQNRRPDGKPDNNQRRLLPWSAQHGTDFL
ncbi:MAG: hypothetical protein MJZ90_03180 [Bacteroidales bacterium]|nr:hypothetical protein [Bacteroidales bacterium]